MNHAALVLLGLALAGWMLVAGRLWLAGRQALARAQGMQGMLARLARMVEENPAQLLVVHADGRLEGSARLAGWLGLEQLPPLLERLDNTPGQGLAPAQLASLREAMGASQRSSRPFRLTLTPPGGQRTLVLRGSQADPQVAPAGAMQIWVFDNSESAQALARLQVDAARARGDFSALVGLIEAAPMPMWFRGQDGALRLVNSAYVAAVGGESAAQVVTDGVELVEPIDGQTPAQVALGAAGRGEAVERLVSATIDGQRRAMRVNDLPLGAEGIAGYAVDVEDMEELARSLRAFREAQRSMLDLLSAGVAQFDAGRRLNFANQPFQRLLALKPADVPVGQGFERLLDLAREGGRVPELRDYPAWRRERARWFAHNGAQEEAWPLSDGTHLRVVAQPMPDGGLLLIVEDRTETLRIAAMRDTLLRTRTATFDSLFEAVAVFAPDGRMQLWNRRFASAWGLESELLDSHPHIGDLLKAVAPGLAQAEEARALGDVVRAATLDRRQTEARLKLADGRVLEFAGVPLPDGNGLLTVLDITDAQKAEAALRERNAALAEADRLKTRFLANMSYEFRTPLTSITGFAELLQAGLGGELSEGGREYVAAILASSARLAEQIENVLDLSQSEAGLLPMAAEAIDLFPFITAIAGDRSARLGEKHLSLDLRGDRSAGQVRGDPRRLGKAVGHLIDNAIAASPEGARIRLDLVTLRQGPGPGGGRIRIIIADQGPGMDSAMLARALGGLKPDDEPGEGALERRQGLGLPLASQLIEAHGGTLDIHSRPGAGTQAIIELPRL